MISKVYIICLVEVWGERAQSCVALRPTTHVRPPFGRRWRMTLVPFQDDILHVCADVCAHTDDGLVWFRSESERGRVRVRACVRACVLHCRVQCRGSTEHTTEGLEGTGRMTWPLMKKSRSSLSSWHLRWYLIRSRPPNPSTPSTPSIHPVHPVLYSCSGCCCC